MANFKVTKTHFERCEPVGKELVKKAEQDRDYRKRWANKECTQSAKEMASYFVAKSVGRVFHQNDPETYERIFGKK